MDVLDGARRVLLATALAQEPELKIIGSALRAAEKHHLSLLEQLRRNRRALEENEKEQIVARMSLSAEIERARCFVTVNAPRARRC